MIDFTYTISIITESISHPVGAIIIGFVSAVVSGILIKMWLNHHFRPILYIDGNVAIDVRKFHLKDANNEDVTFWGNRIRVRNAGLSAAKECKAYVCYTKTLIRRTAWLIRNKESGYTITLNVWDREFVDFCSISDDNQVRIIPAEHGYDQVKRFDEYLHVQNTVGEVTLRITSSNAKPVQRRLKLHTKQENGRIVEFLDQDPPVDKVDNTLLDD